MTEESAADSDDGHAAGLLAEHGYGIASLIVVLGICTALGVPSVLWGPVPGPQWVWGSVGAVLTALAYGPYAIASEPRHDDESARAISHRAGNATLNGLVIMLTVFVLLATIGDDPIVHPETALQVSLGSAIVGYLAVLTVLERRV